MNNELSSSLSHPTRAKLKQESLIVYKNRYEKRDFKMLKEFFEIDNPEHQFLKIFRNFDVDKFEPLSRYLKKKTVKTDPVNIEMLAWLIDFHHRPWALNMQIQLTDEESAILKNPKEQPETENEIKETTTSETDRTAGIFVAQYQPPEIIDEERSDEEKYILDDSKDLPERLDEKPDVPIIDKQSTRNRRIEIIAAIALSVIFLFLGYSIIQLQKKDCMYWSTDHYEMISCDENIPGKDIVGLNEEEYKYLKRIMKVETITKASVDNIFYKKKNNKLELFTAPGRYPLDRSVRLRKLSQSMYDKYNQKDTINKVLWTTQNAASDNP